MNRRDVYRAFGVSRRDTLRLWWGDRGYRKAQRGAERARRDAVAQVRDLQAWIEDEMSQRYRLLAFNPCWVCGEEVGYDDDTILTRFVGLKVEIAHVRCGEEQP